MLQLLTIFIIILFVFIILNYLFIKYQENFCYGNDFCNGNKDSALCISQKCYKCGLQSPCTKDSDCGPNNCINCCCDSF